jgi:peptidoglycan/xylan/chitin deacetylase (PgdA/CDA1 family)
MALRRLSLQGPGRDVVRRDAPFMVTVDVEPDWGIRGCQAIREVLPRLSDLFRRRRVRATFFVVADLLESCAELFREAFAGHEIASHGLTHRVLAGLGEGEVAFELAESRRRLEAAFGCRVAGFRAPFLRTPPGWFRLLRGAGYAYDSSHGAVAPSPRNARPKPWRVTREAGIAEIPAAALRTGWVPFSLTYLRLLAPLGERLISPRAPVVFFHLHELAEPSLVRALPWPMRAALRRNSGAAAWPILDRMLAQCAGRSVTCSEFLGLR